MTLKERFIVEVVNEGLRRVASAGAPRILDLGCGAAGYVRALLGKFPDVRYVGVEPNEPSYKAALRNIEGIAGAKVHFQLGYDSIPGEDADSFDIVFSLSALEHIKNLGRFLALGAKYARSGGLVVHRYDLGHALYPHSFKEWLHVKIGNHFPALLPERRFVRYLSSGEVRTLYEAHGVTPTRTTFHQMPNHKALEKQLRGKGAPVLDDLFTWEMCHQAEFSLVPEAAREKLFPSVAVWGDKR